MNVPPEKFIPPPPNPVTMANHRKQVLWQITVPLLVMVFLCLGLTGLTIWSAVGSSEPVSRWADVSFIWLTPPIILGALITLIIVGGLAYGVYYLVQVLPPYTRLTQDFFGRVQAKTRQISDQLVQPVIRSKGASAGAKELRKQIGGLITRRPK